MSFIGKCQIVLFVLQKCSPCLLLTKVRDKYTFYYLSIGSNTYLCYVLLIVKQCFSVLLEYHFLKTDMPSGLGFFLKKLFRIIAFKNQIIDDLKSRNGQVYSPCQCCSDRVSLGTIGWDWI